ncbi:MAG TPA: oligosaccharide flippase family protein [Alphaproteobacteria bacterium]
MAAHPPDAAVAIRRQVLIATAGNAAGKLVTVVLAFLLMPFLLHRLGELQYGLWILVGSTLAYVALLDLGIADAVTKYVAEHRARGEHARTNEVIAAAFRLYAVLGALALMLSAAFAPIFPGLFAIPASVHATAEVLVLLVGVQVAISIPCAVFAAILRGLQRFGVLNAVGVFGQLVSAAAIVWIVSRGGGLVEIAMASVLVSVGVHGLTAWCVRRLAPELRFGWRGARRGIVRKVVTFSSSMFAMQAASLVQMKAPEIVIGAFLSAGTVAPYAVARRLGLLPQVISDQFLKILVPLASQLDAEKDLRRLRSLYLVASRLTLVVLVLVAGPLVALAGPTLTVWIGPDYAVHAPLVVILTLAIAIETSQWPGMLILRGMARHHHLAVATIGMAVANLALSLLLVRPYGAVGVAVGTLVPIVAVCLGFVLPYTNRMLGVGARDVIRQILLPALLPAVPMAALLHVSGWVVETHAFVSLLATAAAGAAVYMAGYLGLAGDPERQLIRDVLRKTVGILRFGAGRPHDAPERLRHEPHNG